MAPREKPAHNAYSNTAAFFPQEGILRLVVACTEKAIVLESYTMKWKGERGTLKRIKIIAAALLALILVALLCACGAPKQKYIAITFDDGPEYVNTAAVLDGLAARNAKATFFLVGQWTKGKDELIRRIENDGHQIGCHTVSHEALTDMTDEEVRAELNGFREIMRQYTEQTEFWLRPPYGFCDERVAALCGVPIILWSIDPAAGKNVPAEKMARTIIRQARDGAIILMHDTTEANVEASLAAIDALQAKGYAFVTVEELMRIKGVEPQAGETYRRIR